MRALWRMGAVAGLCLTAPGLLLAQPASLLDRTVATPPEADRIETEILLHGDRLVDPYAWLRDAEDPAVLAYLDAENAYSDTVLTPIKPLYERLFAEMSGRMADEYEYVWSRIGDDLYTLGVRAGDQHWNILRRPVFPSDAPIETILDTNAVAAEEEYFALIQWDVTRDGRYLAYQADLTGGLDYEIRIVDLAGDGPVAGPISGADGFAWAPDNATLFHVAVDERSLRPFEVRRIPADGSAPATIVHAEDDEEFDLHLSVTSDRRFVVIEASSSDTTETYLLDPWDPQAVPVSIRPRERGLLYTADHGGGQVYLRINDDASTYRIVATPFAELDAQDWRPILPSRPDVSLEGFHVFARHLAVSERSEGLAEIRIVDLATLQQTHVAFPEPSYSLFQVSNPQFDTNVVLYGYESFVTPQRVYAYDMQSHETEIVWEEPIGGGFDGSPYAIERVFATASDGTRIPISLAYRRDTPIDGTAPVLLEAYGAYGAVYDPFFDRTILSLLDRGMIFAWAHVRGGGEYGFDWYEAGRLARKMNTFTDVVAAAEHLIASGYAAADRLVGTGTSAGGLTMAAAINLRPDLFRAAVLNVPFVDVLTAMLDPQLPLTTLEYPEWGNPAVAEEYGWMRAYDPYVNLAPGRYPDMLVLGGLTDSQVPFWQPAKYVARLRDVTGGETLVLLSTNMGAGHAGEPGRFDSLRQWALQYAFVLAAVGIGE